MDYPEFPGAIVINTDGSSFHNGKPDAIAGVGVFFGKNDKRNIGAPLGPGKQTNQRAELTAVKRALEAAPIDRNVVIRSDSKYAINCLTGWYLKWRLQSWKKPAGILKENMNLIESTLQIINLRRVNGASTSFFWVQGHNGDPGNEAADRLATRDQTWNLRKCDAELEREGFVKPAPYRVQKPASKHTTAKGKVFAANRSGLDTRLCSLAISH